jgi:hypothetical protein
MSSKTSYLFKEISNKNSYLFKGYKSIIVELASY